MVNSLISRSPQDILSYVNVLFETLPKMYHSNVSELKNSPYLFNLSCNISEGSEMKESWWMMNSTTYFDFVGMLILPSCQANAKNYPVHLKFVLSSIGTKSRVILDNPTDSY